MTVYTVDFKKWGNWQTYTAAFKTLEHAKNFAKCDYTDRVITHNFKDKENAFYFVANKCSFADFVENLSNDEGFVLKQMAKIEEVLQ